MGSAAALAAFARPAAGPLGAVLAAMAEPALLAQAFVGYGLAYATYGSVTIALGAAAGDVASAQNLSRPMFGVLLIAFFAALSSAMGAGEALAWTLWLPPLTPFMWLLGPPAAEPLFLMAVTAVACCALASSALNGPKLHRRKLMRTPVPHESGL
jgi:ABC-2 type transport system permease protein